MYTIWRSRWEAFQDFGSLINKTENDPEETRCALCLYPQVARSGGSGNTVLSRRTQISAPTASGVQPPIMTPACPNSVTTSRS